MSTDTALPEWYVISLRPRGQHAPMRRAAARHGGDVIALSPWRLQPLDNELARGALRAALAAPRVVFTSPAAVHAAAALQPLRAHAGQQWFAVGAGSASALREAGIEPVFAPERMDSEGLLALPGLRQLDRGAVGLVTAPRGRGTLAPALRARGADVLQADVYQRVPVPPSPCALAELRGLARPAAIALSSGEALQLVLAAVPDDVAARLTTLPVVGASERLLELAATLGFRQRHRAASARPDALVDAVAALLR